MLSVGSRWKCINLTSSTTKDAKKRRGEKGGTGWGRKQKGGEVWTGLLLNASRAKIGQGRELENMAGGKKKGDYSD